MRGSLPRVGVLVAAVLAGCALENPAGLGWRMLVDGAVVDNGNVAVDAGNGVDAAVVEDQPAPVDDKEGVDVPLAVDEAAGDVGAVETGVDVPIGPLDAGDAGGMEAAVVDVVDAAVPLDAGRDVVMVDQPAPVDVGRDSGVPMDDGAIAPIDTGNDVGVDVRVDTGVDVVPDFGPVDVEAPYDGPPLDAGRPDVPVGVDVPPPQCGGNDQSCCGSNCNAGFYCGSITGRCRPCGGRGQVCCPGFRCSGNLNCYGLCF